MSKRGLTLLEVILALGIMAVGIALSLELLGRLSAANNDSVLTLEQRVLEARELVDQADWSQTKAIFKATPTWQVSPNITATQTAQSAVEHPNTLALDVHLLDSNAQELFGFSMLKLRDPQP